MSVSVRAQFGKPKYGAKLGNKIFRILESKPNEPVTNIYRIIPPIKTGIEDGRWTAFFAQHFGYGGVDKSDAKKTKARPFACPKKENFNTKMVLVPCAECDKIESQKALLASRQQALEAEGRTEEEIDALLAPLKSWCRNHNQDRKWYMNVMNQAGEFGTLAIPHKAMGKLKARIEECQKDEDIGDPMDFDKGAWFDFRRTGKGRTTEYDVFIHKVKVDIGGGKKAEIAKPAPLSDAQLEQVLKECPDLLVGSLMRVVSTEQVAMLVASSGDPEEIDAIMGTAVKVEESASPKPKFSAANQAAQAVKPAAPAQPSLQISGDEEAELERQLAAARAKRLAAQKAEVAPARKPAPAVDLSVGDDDGDGEDLSPEELVKLFKKK